MKKPLTLHRQVAVARVVKRHPKMTMHVCRGTCFLGTRMLIDYLARSMPLCVAAGGNMV